MMMKRGFSKSFSNGITCAVATALQALKNQWTTFPASWRGSDPCGTWDGIKCRDNRIVSM